LQEDLKLSDRIYECTCGLKIDRDLNASFNIVRLAKPDFKPVEIKALVIGSNTDNETLFVEAGT